MRMRRPAALAVVVLTTAACGTSQAFCWPATTCALTNWPGSTVSSGLANSARNWSLSARNSAMVIGVAASMRFLVRRTARRQTAGRIASARRLAASAPLRSISRHRSCSA